jgi:hypothetical protein
MTRSFSQRWALALLLLSLHGVMLWGFDAPLTKTLLVIHYGLFLLWQPIWRGEQPLTPGTGLLFLAGGALLLLAVNWWILAFWAAGLFGLLGGRVFSTQEKSARTGYLVAAAHLLAILLIWVGPKLLRITSQEESLTEAMMAYILPILPVMILFLPGERKSHSAPPPLDFFYSLILFLLAVILVLGSLAIAASGKLAYLEALIRMLFVIAAVLLTMSWLWNPRAGFAGIGQLLSRYLLSIGMPFEQWLNRITRLAEVESTPEQFIAAATAEVASLPWVSGGQWKTAESSGTFGNGEDSYSATFSYHEFGWTLYARHPLTPVLMLHIKLLTQLLGEFYEAKKREALLREQSYMRAVYETGSRLTHDIKNLVQSLSTLCAAVENTEKQDSEKLVALIQRQLPLLNRRLALTLEKLQAPHTDQLRYIRTSTWWRNLKKRYEASPVQFSSQGLSSHSTLCAEIFDNVADNLLQNVLEKARNESGISIQVMLTENPYPCLIVRDSGKAIPEKIARALFKSRIPSESGLGIGLLNAFKLAQRIDYAIALTNNANGEVSFSLSKSTTS